MDSDRLWLDVPFAENNEAKAAGARWDPGDAPLVLRPAPVRTDVVRWKTTARPAPW